MKYHKTILAFGGNLGDTLLNFKKATNYLEQHGLIFNKKSSIYTTPAVNCEPEAKDFYNFAALCNWSNSPENLLKLTQATEQKLGRPLDHSSFESRFIDIDIILFENKIIVTDDLVIPHPRAHERLFVMIPLSEIEPDWIFPNLKTPANKIIKQLKSSNHQLYKKIINSKQTIML